MKRQRRLNRTAVPSCGGPFAGLARGGAAARSAAVRESRSLSAPQASPPAIEELEPRQLLSIAMGNVVPNSPLAHVVQVALANIENALPAEIKEVVMPHLHSLMGANDSAMIYQAFPGEVNQVQVWGDLANALLMLNESKDVSLWRALTFSFDPIEKIGIGLLGKVHAGASFIGEICGGLGVKADGLEEFLWKQIISPAEVRAIGVNEMALLDLFPALGDFINGFDSFLDLSLSDLFPDEVTIIPPIRLFGKTVWDGLTLRVPDWLQNFPTLRDLVGSVLPTPLRDAVNVMQGIVDLLTAEFRLDGIYVSTLDGNDAIDLSRLTGIPQTAHGDLGNDTIMCGGGQDLLASWGFPLAGAQENAPVRLYGDSGDDTFIINQFYDCMNCTIDGGPGEDRMVIQGTDASDIIRLIAGPDGKLAEIRFERLNPRSGSPVNEQQRVVMPSDVDGGTFVLKAEGWPATDATPWNASALAVQTALVNAARKVDPGLGPEDIHVTGGSGTWDVEFHRALGGKNFRPMVVDGTNLTRRVTAALVATQREGGNGGTTPIANEIQEIRLPQVTGGTFTLQFGAYPKTDPISYRAGPRDIEFALLQTGLPQTDFKVTGPYGGPWQIEFTGTRAKMDVPTIVVDGSGLTGAIADWELTRKQPGFAPANEVQLVHVPLEASGGTFTLTFEVGGARRTTAPIRFDAVPAEVADALGALATVGGRGNVAAALEPDGSFRVEFLGDLAGADQPLLQADAGGLQGVGVTTLGDGGGGVNERQQVALTEAPQGGRFRLTFGTKTTATISAGASALDVQSALAALSDIGAGNVQVTGPAGGPWTVEFIDALGSTNVTQMTAGFVIDVQETTPGSGGTNEAQTLHLPPGITGGQLRLAVRTPLGMNAAYVAPDVDAAGLEDALEALDCVGTGNVHVTGGGAFDITFTGDLAAAPIDAILADTRFLSGGAVPTVEVYSPLVVNEIQTVSIPYPQAVEGTFKLQVPTRGTTGDIGFGASPQDVQTALETVVGAGNVAVTGKAGAWSVEFTGSMGGKDVDPMTVQGGLTTVNGADVPVDELTAGNDGADTTVVATTRFTELKDAEALEIKGGVGDDVLIVDNSAGPILLPEEIRFEGGEGYNRVIFIGDKSKTATVGEHRSNRVTMTFGDKADEFQLVNYFSSTIYDFVPAQELRVLGSSAGEEIEIGPGDYDGTPVGLVSVSGGATPMEYGDGGSFEVYYQNKDALVLRAAGGDDPVKLDITDLPAGLTSVTIDGGSSVDGDTLLIDGTDQGDAFDFIPTSMKGGSLIVSTGGRSVNVELAGIEALEIDALEQGAGTDSLVVHAANAAVVPGDFPGTGEATAIGAAGLPRLAVKYANMEGVDLRGMEVLTFEGSPEDDVIEVRPTQVICYDFFGHANVSDVTGAEIVYLCLGEGNDQVTVTSSSKLPFQLEILGGGSDPNGDAVIFTGSGGRVALDLSDQSLTETAGSHVTYTGIESFAIGTVGGPLAVSTSEDDETLQVTPLDRNTGRLALNGSALTVRYAGVAGLPVALDLAGGQDTLVVNGSSAGDAAVLTADSVTFTDDGRSLTYAGVEALTLNGLQGDDRLDVDNSAGLVVLPGGAFFDGGPGRDVLRLLGPREVDSITYDVGPGAGAGTIVHKLAVPADPAASANSDDGGDSDDLRIMEQVVSFVNPEQVIDLVRGPLAVNGTPDSDIINYDVGPNSGGEVVEGLDTMQVSINGFEALEFGAKTAMTIDGLAGHDAIDLNNAVNPPELAAITLDGGSGNDALIGSAGDDVLIGGRGDDVLLGQDGDDVLIPGLGGDRVDGGRGDDTAIFTGTGGDDTAGIRAGEVTVNGEADTIANVERVTLDTLAGNDGVFVEAAAGFPDRADVATGTGDDNILVLLHNPAPPTTIAVNGGPHVAGDSATVKGMVGDDQFTAYGAVNVFGAAVAYLSEVEDPAVLEDRRIDSDPKTVESSRFVFGDADGNVSTVHISGPGTVDVFRNIIHGRNADVHLLELAGTDEALTGVSVGVRKARGTDNRTSIGAIRGSGAAAISAPFSDLVGEGLDLTGGLGSLVVNDIRDGADVRLGGESGQFLSLSANQVGNVDLSTGRRIRSLKVASWTAGTIRGSTLDSVVATQGPFGADLVNTRQNWFGYGVKNVSIQGDLTTHILADRVRSIRVRNGDATVHVTATSDAATLFGRTAVGSFSVVGGDVLGADFSIQPRTLLGKFEVRAARGMGGNVTCAVNITGDLGNTFIGGNLMTSGWTVAGSMGDFVVQGVAQAASGSAAVRAGGSMGAIALGEVRHLDFLAGIAPDVARQPDDPADFATQAVIESIRVKGRRMPPGTPAPRFMADSNFSAASMGVVRLLNAEPGSTGLFVRGAGGGELKAVVHRDTVDPTMNFGYPPKPGEVFSPPFPLVNIL